LWRIVNLIACTKNSISITRFKKQPMANYFKFPDLERVRKHDFREVVKELLYLIGGQWRMMPEDFRNWAMVCSYFNCWKQWLIIGEGNQNEPLELF
jgi:hypothetical protein